MNGLLMLVIPIATKYHLQILSSQESQELISYFFSLASPISFQIWLDQIIISNPRKIRKGSKLAHVTSQSREKKVSMTQGYGGTDFPMQC